VPAAVHGVRRDAKLFLAVAFFIVLLWVIGPGQ
jgi:hypothetical protein